MKRRSVLNGKVASVAVVVVAVACVIELFKSESSGATDTRGSHGTGSNSSASQPATSVDLSPSQLNSIKIAPVGTHLFPVEREAVRTISLADDLSVEVFPNYQGKLIKALVELGDTVQKEQPLYTIDSPDLIQAESTLIGAAQHLN